MAEDETSNPLIRSWGALKGAYFAIFMAIYDALVALLLFEQESSLIADRAVIGLTLLELVTFASVEMWLLMLGVVNFERSRMESWGIAVMLGLFNYVVILRDRRWFRYMQSFHRLPDATQRKIKWTARTAVVVAAIGCAATFTRLVAFWKPGR